MNAIDIARTARLAALVVTLVALTACPPPPPPDPGALAVGVSGGGVLGVDDNGVRTFRGIPYAAPPVGSLRFERPQPHPGWTAPLDLSAADPSLKCPQRVEGVFEGTEDCLTMNVHAPYGATGLPVMVWIHGGAFIEGSNNFAFYDGTDLAQNGVVVMAMNYRLGSLGFLADEGLMEADGGAGNLGLWDQGLALQWAKDNAAAFGGDGENITLFGQSAGAVSVMSHLASPETAALFDRVIIESGGAGYYVAESNHDAFTRDQGVIDALGCGTSADVRACLKDPGLAPTDFVDALFSGARRNLFGDPESGVHVDGAFLEQTPYAAALAGQADKPMIIGSNADEGRPLPTEPLNLPDAAAFRALIVPLPGIGEANADEILVHYNAANMGDWDGAHAALVTDAFFTCGAELMAQANKDGEPAFLYHFTLPFPGWGAFHGMEMSYVFGWGIVPEIPFFAEDQALSDEMQNVWTSFARTGDPSFSLPWDRYNRATPSIAIFDHSLDSVMSIRNGRCSLLRNMGVIPAMPE